jgi:hypothetical protein
LEIGDEQYQVIKQTETEISIGDTDYIHIFARQLKDQTSADASASINERTLPSKPVTSIDTMLLNGNWEAYSRKRKDGQPGKINYNTLLKTVSFHSNIIQHSYGIVTVNNGASVFSIKALKDADIIITDNNNKEHRIIVWKLSKNELIIEDEESILYYMKQF